MVKAVFQQIFNHKVDAIGLSIFRMCYALVLFFEVLHLFHFRHIIFDQIPYSYTGELNFLYLFIFWTIVLFLIFIGLFTRTALLVNCLLGIVVFGPSSHYQYHVYYTYVAVNFLMVFMPMSRVLSLDSLWKKLKYSSAANIFTNDRKILEINYLMPVYAGIALIYFDSVFHKINSYIWTHGLGVWFPSSMPMAVWNDTSLLLNHESAVLFLGYFVFFFETVFIFLFWFRKLRVPLMLIGIFFHIGILVAYPIPYFALSFIVIYLLLIPASFFIKVSEKAKLKKARYTFHYDPACEFYHKLVIFIAHFDIFGTVSFNPAGQHQKGYGVTSAGKTISGFDAYVQLLKAMGYTYPLALLLTIPGISHLAKIIYESVANARSKNNNSKSQLPVYSIARHENQAIFFPGWSQLALTKRFWKIIISVYFAAQCLTIASLMPAPAVFFAKKVVGIYKHGLFLDFHFFGIKHAFKVMYVDADGKTLVPIFDDNGMPSDYLSGGLWTNIFRVLGDMTPETMREINPFLIHFLHTEKPGSTTGKFEIYMRNTTIPLHWQKDFLHKEMAKPWTKTGECTVSGSTVNFEWNQAMQPFFDHQ